MRVITGTARGVRLLSPEGRDTRPTADRVKEALFSIIQFEVEGRQVLDLFAGTGQLGIEALSRGAAHAVFVDSSKVSLELVRENLKKTRLDAHAEVVQSDFESYLAHCRQKFDLIFLDPPYSGAFLENALQRISEIDILSNGGIIICERPTEKSHPGQIPGFTASKDYRYGGTFLTLYRQAKRLEDV